jgi:hypothetical protein
MSNTSVDLLNFSARSEHQKWTESSTSRDVYKKSVDKSSSANDFSTVEQFLSTTQPRTRTHLSGIAGCVYKLADAELETCMESVDNSHNERADAYAGLVSTLLDALYDFVDGVSTLAERT